MTTAHTRTTPHAAAPHAPSRLASIARAAAIPLGIAAILSGLMTWLNLGLVPDFAWRWFTSFLSALPVMALGLLLMQAYDKLLRRTMAQAPWMLRTLVLAALMALTLETLLSFVVTLRNVGLVDGFSQAWASAFLRSLPVGLAIGLLMGFIIKPWLQRRANALVGA